MGGHEDNTLWGTMCIAIGLFQVVIATNKTSLFSVQLGKNFVFDYPEILCLTIEFFFKSLRNGKMTFKRKKMLESSYAWNLSKSLLW